MGTVTRTVSALISFSFSIKYHKEQVAVSLCVSGIAVMMSLCQEVNVYEFLPSLRRSNLCHYYERYRDAACMLGAYHLLLYEKLLVQRMNTGHRHQLVTKGKVTLRGFSSFRCPS